MNTPRTALLLAAVVCFGAAAAESFAQAAHVVSTQGVTIVERAGEAVRIVGAGQALASGDVVRVAHEGHALLEFRDTTRVSLRPNTVFRIDDYSDAQPHRMLLGLRKGGFRAVTGGMSNTPGAIRVHTDITVLGVRGTAFDVRLCEDDCAREEASAATPAIGPHKAVARVLELRGAAAAAEHGGMTRVLNAGAALYAGEGVATGPDSYAVLAFTDGSRITLAERSQLVIASFDYDARGQRGRAHVALLAGHAQVMTGRLAKISPDAYVFESAMGIIRPRGTGFNASGCIGKFCASVSGSAGSGGVSGSASASDGNNSASGSGSANQSGAQASGSATTGGTTTSGSASTDQAQNDADAAKKKVEQAAADAKKKADAVKQQARQETQKQATAAKEKAGQTAAAVKQSAGVAAQDPAAFIKTVIQEVKDGAAGAGGKVSETALAQWIVSRMVEAGIPPPQDVSLRGVLTSVAQLGAASADRLRDQIDTRFGPEAGKLVDALAQNVQVLVTQGPGGFWAAVKTELTEQKNALADAAQQKLKQTKDALQKAPEVAANAAKTAASGVVEGAEAIAERITDAATEVTKTVTGGVVDLVTKTAEKLSNAPGPGDLLAELKRAAQQAAKEASEIASRTPGEVTSNLPRLPEPPAAKPLPIPVGPDGAPVPAPPSPDVALKEILWGDTFIIRVGEIDTCVGCGPDGKPRPGANVQVITIVPDLLWGDTYTIRVGEIDTCVGCGPDGKPKPGAKVQTITIVPDLLWGDTYTIRVGEIDTCVGCGPDGKPRPGAKVQTITIVPDLLWGDTYMIRVGDTETCVGCASDGKPKPGARVQTITLLPELPFEDRKRTRSASADQSTDSAAGTQGVAMTAGLFVWDGAVELAGHGIVRSGETLRVGAADGSAADKLGGMLRSAVPRPDRIRIDESSLFPEKDRGRERGLYMWVRDGAIVIEREQKVEIAKDEAVVVTRDRVERLDAVPGFMRMDRTPLPERRAPESTLRVFRMPDGSISDICAPN